MAEKPEKGARGKRAQAGEGRRGQQRDPAKMVARIMTEFDKDGDEKLDKTELAAWLKAMHERRGQRMRPGGKAGKGKAGQGKAGRGKAGKGKAGKGKAGRGKRGSEDQGRPGGELPIRPEAE